LTTYPIGKEKYLIKFRACAEKLAVHQPQFLVTSKIEQFVASTYKVIQSGKCYEYHTQVNAKNSVDIQIEYITNPGKYKDLKSRMI
jgi:hypothetical protein